MDTASKCLFSFLLFCLVKDSLPVCGQMVDPKLILDDRVVCLVEINSLGNFIGDVGARFVYDQEARTQRSMTARTESLLKSKRDYLKKVRDQNIADLGLGWEALKLVPDNLRAGYLNPFFQELDDIGRAKAWAGIFPGRAFFSVSSKDRGAVYCFGFEFSKGKFDWPEYFEKQSEPVANEDVRFASKSQVYFFCHGETIYGAADLQSCQKLRDAVVNKKRTNCLGDSRLFRRATELNAAYQGKNKSNGDTNAVYVYINPDRLGESRWPDVQKAIGFENLEGTDFNDPFGKTRSWLLATSASIRWFSDDHSRVEIDLCHALPLPLDSEFQFLQDCRPWKDSINVDLPQETLWILATDLVANADPQCLDRLLARTGGSFSPKAGAFDVGKRPSGKRLYFSDERTSQMIGFLSEHMADVSEEDSAQVCENQNLAIDGITELTHRARLAISGVHGDWHFMVKDLESTIENGFNSKWLIKENSEPHARLTSWDLDFVNSMIQKTPSRLDLIAIDWRWPQPIFTDLLETDFWEQDIFINGYCQNLTLNGLSLFAKGKDQLSKAEGMSESEFLRETWLRLRCAINLLKYEGVFPRNSPEYKKTSCYTFHYRNRPDSGLWFMKSVIRMTNSGMEERNEGNKD